MNISEDEKRRRESQRQPIREFVADFQASEEAVLAAAEGAVIEAIRRNYPVVAGCAIQSGTMTGRLTLDLLFDLTPGRKVVEVHAVVQPPPIASTIRREVAVS